MLRKIVQHKDIALRKIIIIIEIVHLNQLNAFRSMKKCNSTSKHTIIRFTRGNLFYLRTVRAKAMPRPLHGSCCVDKSIGAAGFV